MKKYTLWFDMDGTLGNLYAVDDWLPKIRHEDASPYLDAAPMLRFCTLARLLNALQRNGYEIGIISWLSKSGSESYGNAVTAAKKEWLSKHLPSVTWDKITIVPYGTPKNDFCESPLDILFDDEKPNRDSWGGKAYEPSEILEVLKNLKDW